MNTNTYLKLILAACLSIPSTYLLASEQDVVYPSEQQLEQREQKTSNLNSVDEPLIPSKHYKEQKKHKKAASKVPAKPASDDAMEPSEQKLEQK